MISYELDSFYQRWLLKAEQYGTQSLQDCFDRFFTLFVAYNRLYSELAIAQVKQGRWRYPYYSDSLAAKKNVRMYLGGRYITQNIENDIECSNANLAIISLLDVGAFRIKFDLFNVNSEGGNPVINRRRVPHFFSRRPMDNDFSLLNKLKSDIANEKADAILDIIYSIRCNMFHGQKGYDNKQVKLLVPVTTLLEKISWLLYNKMCIDSDLLM